MIFLRVCTMRRDKHAFWSCLFDVVFLRGCHFGIITILLSLGCLLSVVIVRQRRFWLVNRLVIRLHFDILRGCFFGVVRGCLFGIVFGRLRLVSLNHMVQKWSSNEMVVPSHHSRLLSVDSSVTHWSLLMTHLVGLGLVPIHLEDPQSRFPLAPCPDSWYDLIGANRLKLHFDTWFLHAYTTNPAYLKTQPTSQMPSPPTQFLLTLINSCFFPFFERPLLVSSSWSSGTFKSDIRFIFAFLKSKKEKKWKKKKN